jgi:hypothetical protein
MSYTESMTTLTCTKCASDFSITSKFCQTWREGTDTTLWCPCCNRTFLNVQRHMASKHPELKDRQG